MNKWPIIKARLELAIEHGDAHGWYVARNELLGIIGSDYGAPDTIVNPMALHAPSSCVMNCGSGEPCDTTRCPLPDPNDPEHQ